MWNKFVFSLCSVSWLVSYHLCPVEQHSNNIQNDDCVFPSCDSSSKIQIPDLKTLHHLNRGVDL